jgi:hypothetical protein
VADLERLVCLGRSDNICAVLPGFSDAESFNSFLVVLARRAEPGPNNMYNFNKTGFIIGVI